VGRLFKFTLLGALYLVQGLPYGFFTQALPVLLRKADASLTLIGLSHLLTLPWALKFLWAPAVDRIYIRSLGLRKSWLIPLQVATITTYLGLGFVEFNFRIEFVLFAFLLANLLAASQDIATDGLAIDILSSEERGVANGVQVAGYRIGMIIGGGALLALYDWLTWSGVMFTIAIISAIGTLPIFFYSENQFHRPHLPPRTHTFLSAVRESFHFFLQPGALLWLPVLLLYKAGHASATAMLRPWLVDRGYNLTEIAKLLSTAGFMAGLIGALLGGWLASRFDRIKLLAILALGQFIAVTAYLYPIVSEHSLWKVATAIALDHLVSGMATATLFAVMMDLCSKERSASDYTAQACIVVVAQGAGSALAGPSAHYLGYEVHFALAASAAGLSAFLTFYLLRRNWLHQLLLTTREPTVQRDPAA
jgi:PAT family beta-lactamase induction signal transducer AmpG